LVQISRKRSGRGGVGKSSQAARWTQSPNRREVDSAKNEKKGASKGREELNYNASGFFDVGTGKVAGSGLWGNFDQSKIWYKVRRST